MYFCGLLRVLLPSQPPSTTNQGRPTEQLGSLDEKKSALAVSLKGTLIKPPVLALPKTQGPYTLDTDAFGKNSGLYSFESKNTGVTVLLATGLEHLTTRNKKCPKRTEDVWQPYSPSQFCAIIWKDPASQSRQTKKHYDGFLP